MLTAAPLALVAALGQDPGQVDALRALAVRPSAGTIEAHVGRRPDDAPEAVRLLLRQAVAEPTDQGPLAGAERIARAYAAAWRDSSLVWRVVAFRGRTPGQRRVWADADSALQAGRTALYRGGADSAIAVWRGAERRFAAIADTAGLAAALGNIGAAYYADGHLDSAERHLGRARDLARRARSPRVAANAVMALGSVALERGDLALARARYAEGLALAVEAGDQRGQAAAHHNLGAIAEQLGDVHGATGAYEAALALNRAHAHPDGAAANLEGLGNVAVLAGDVAEAEVRYGAALAIYRERDEPRNAAHVLLNLGLLATRFGDYAAAVRWLAESVLLSERAGSAADVVDARRALAVARAAMGDLESAGDELDAAVRAAERADLGPEVAGGLALTRADLAVRFNELVEAERAYEAAGAWFERAGSTLGRAEAQQGLALLLLARDEPSRARDLLDLALGTQESEGDARAAAWTRVLLSAAYRALGYPDSAATALREAAGTFRRLNDKPSEAGVLGETGDLARVAGRPRAAEGYYRDGLALLGSRPSPDVAWRLYAGLGAALAARGADAEAAEALRTALDAVEATAFALGAADLRSAFLADKWDVYGRLAALEQRRGRAAAAFEASEQMRARQMLETLTHGRPRMADDGVQTLADREQILRQRLAELGAAPSATRDLPGAPSADERTTRLRTEHAAVLRDLRRRAPGLGATLSHDAVRAADIAARLASDQAVLEYLVGDSTTIAFVVTRDTVAALDLNVGRRALARQVAFVRGAIGAHDDPSARDAWRVPLHRLHAVLVAPVERTGLLRGVRRLLVAPHAELHYLPFEALPEDQAGRRLLLGRYEVAYIPSAAVWLRLAETVRAQALGTVLAVAPHPDALPGSRRELEAIGRLYGARARLLAGAEASEDAVRADAVRYDAVHFATFGVLNRRSPLFSYLSLGAAPGGDGRLEVREVFGLDLRAHVVVLSACETAVGAGARADVPAGDEWLSLLRAFLQAGAGSVVATLWPVADAETADMVGSFFAELRAGASPPAALTRAKRLLAADPRTAHPYYWAGFVIGGGT